MDCESICETLKSVAKPNDIILEEPHIYKINLTPHCIDFGADSDFGPCALFNDRNAFVSALAKFQGEAESIANMLSIAKKANEYSIMLYTWRSCTIPLPKDLPLEGQTIMLEILEKEMAKLKDLMNFQKENLIVLQDKIKEIALHWEVVSSQYLDIFIHFLSTFATLDEMKNIKSSAKNDFAYFKRAREKYQRSSEGANELREMSMFLAIHDGILNEMRLMLSNANNGPLLESLCEFINACVVKLEQKSYFLTEEKYDLIKSIGFLLCAMDCTHFNIHKHKKLNMAKIETILKETKIIPIYGDTSIMPYHYIRKSINFEASNCSRNQDELTSSLVQNFFEALNSKRILHNQLVCELIGLFTKLAPYNLKDKNDNLNENIPNELCSQTYYLVSKTITAISGWTSSIKELISWKLSHPAEVIINANIPGCPETATNFERVTKYNYNADEKHALIETIGFVKSVHNMLSSNLYILVKAIGGYIFEQLQIFLIHGLAEPLRKAIKHKKDLISSTLNAIINVCADESSHIQTSVVSQKKIKKSDSKQEIFLKNKYAYPSKTQLFLVRSMLESLFQKNGSKSAPSKDIDLLHVKILKDFLQMSTHWHHFVSFNTMLETCTDLSQIWYREFYIEMTKGENVQFSIDQSLPWILAEHILETKDPCLIHYLFNVFDLYNDSSKFALLIFRQQFLYAEIEAEAFLCFEQMLFKLSENIYENYKVQASGIYLERVFVSHCGKVGMKITRVNYLPFFDQNCIQLIGQSINVKLRLTQSINDFIIKSISAAISRFETQDITAIIELNGLIEICRMTHKLLNKYLPLDTFHQLFEEANHSVKSPLGRIALYLLMELSIDFLPQYCYNSTTNRFVRTVLPFADKVVRDRLPIAPAYHLWGNKFYAQCYVALNALYNGFVGQPHFEAIINLINYHGRAMLVNELTEFVKTIIQSCLIPYLNSMKEVMPQKCILPRYDYKSKGVLDYFSFQLQAILNFSDLQPKVFQSLREIGNAILFVYQLENSQAIRESVEIISSGMFMKIIPEPFISNKGDMEVTEVRDEALAKQKVFLENKYRHQDVLTIISRKGSEEQVKELKENVTLTKEKIATSSLRLFSGFLQFLRESVRLVFSQEYSEGIKAGALLWNVEKNKEFHRLWSAMQFVFCRTLGKNELTIEELFGEGLQWAGCGLVYFLDQQRRFEMFDPAYYLQNVNRCDQMDELCNGVPLRAMVERIRRFQLLNQTVFSILANQLTNSNTIAPSATQNFEPSVFDGGNIIINSRVNSPEGSNNNRISVV